MLFIKVCSRKRSDLCIAILYKSIGAFNREYISTGSRGNEWELKEELLNSPLCRGGGA